MTPFSSVLEVYMREKDIKTYSIAKFCGVDRSNMYKIISGKRNPASEEIVDRIAEYMRLRLMERNHLMEAYQITLMGYDTYHRRKSIQDFLMSFLPDSLKTEGKSSGGEYVTVHVDKQKLALRQKDVVEKSELKDLISGILHIEMQKPSGKIYLLMQPEAHYIMKFLAEAGSKKKDLHIEHIFCLNNTNDIVSNKKNYNVCCLNHIFPMFTQCVCDYQPYCYYDNILSHNNRFNFLSSMILTSEYAVVFSMEEKYGMLLSGEDTIQHLYSLFQSLKEDTNLMAMKMNSIYKQLKSFETIDFDEKGIRFQPDAGIISMVPATLWEKYLNRQMKTEKIFQNICRFKQRLEASESSVIFTESGIRRFLDTGRILELPDSVYDSFDYMDRQMLVRRLIQECGAGKYRMLRADEPIAETGIGLYSGMQEGCLLLPLRQGDRLFLELRETGLLYAFRDYFETLDEKSFYDTDETICILKASIKRKPV